MTWEPLPLQEAPFGGDGCLMEERVEQGLRYSKFHVAWEIFVVLLLCSNKSLVSVLRESVIWCVRKSLHEGCLQGDCSSALPPTSPYFPILCGLNEVSAPGLGVSSFAPQLLGLFGEDMECLGGRGLAGGNESLGFIARPVCYPIWLPTQCDQLGQPPPHHPQHPAMLHPFPLSHSQPPVPPACHSAFLWWSIATCEPKLHLSSLKSLIQLSGPSKSNWHKTSVQLS